MEIDQAQFNFSPTLGLAVAVMVSAVRYRAGSVRAGCLIWALHLTYQLSGTLRRLCDFH